MDKETIEKLIDAQRDEVTSGRIYTMLAGMQKDAHNKEILFALSRQEAKHAELLKKYTSTSVKGNSLEAFKYNLLARILGITFAVKRAESGERKAEQFYSSLTDYPEIQQIAQDEKNHEEKLIELIDEERLKYMGSVVLGLNDALVEFTGALAGFTLALSSAPLIALTGSVTGIAASLSMALSEYLSTKSDKSSHKRPVKAAIYTGIAYVITVVTLILPFVLVSNVFIALAIMLVMAIIIIALFNYYYAVACSENFKHRFTEMAILSLSVSALSFVIGYLLKSLTGLDA